MNTQIEPIETRARPKRFGLWALAILGLLISSAALALAILVGRPVSLPNWAVNEIKARVAVAAPALNVEFGDVSVILDKGLRPKIQVRDLAVGLAAGRPMLTLTEMRSSFALLPLLKGKLHPTTMALIGGNVLVRRDARGGFNVAFGASKTAVREATRFTDLIEELDAVLLEPALVEFQSLHVEALTLRYEDARAKRAWTADGGRIEISRSGDDLSLRGDLAVLGGRDYASSLELTYNSNIGSPRADFGVAFQDMPAEGIAHQAPALAWLEVLRAPISGALRGEIDQTGTLGPLSATLQIGAGVLQPTNDIKPIPFSSARSYLTYTPQSGTLKFDELSVQSKWISVRADGQAVLQGLEKGWPTAILGQFNLGNMRANPMDLYPKAITLDGANLDMKLELNPFSLTIGELALTDQGQVLAISGALKAEQDGWDVSLSGKMPALSLERLKELWPASLAENTRNWIEENILTGKMQNLQLGVRSLPTRRPDVYLGFDFSDLETLFMRTMPPIKGGAGHATLYRDRFVVTAEQGQVIAPQGGVVDITGTSFIVPYVRVKETPAEVDLSTNSTITAALSLLDQPPLSYMSKVKQPVTIADGRAVLTGKINLLLKKKLPPNEITFDIAGEMSNVRTEKIVPGRVLTAAQLQVRANGEGLTISGAGRIGQVPFDGTFSAGLDGESNTSTVRGWVELSERFVDEFRIGLPAGSLSGNARADVKIDLVRGKKPDFTLTSDLSGLALRLKPLGWSLGTGTKGKLSVAGRLDSPPQIDSITFDAPGLQASGKVSLTSNGQLERASFSRVRAGDWLNAPVDLIGRGAGREPAVRVNGGTIDMSKTAIGSGDGGGASSASAGPLTLALDVLQISDGIKLTNFKGDFLMAGGMSGRFVGLVNGDAQVSGQVVPYKGRSAFRIQSKNAGAVLRSAGLLKQARGGELDLTLAPSGEKGSYNGVLRVVNTRLQDAPAMAALLNAMSIVGLLEQAAGNGIHFSEVDAKFRLNPKQVIVTESSAVGASMGLSMDGIYTLGSGAMDMQGVISPVFLLNGIGSVLTRKGEGLLGFNYRLRGTASAPRVQVNPLSIFTPGMFREIFRRPPPKVRP